MTTRCCSCLLAGFLCLAAAVLRSQPDSGFSTRGTQLYSDRAFKPAWFARGEVEANAEESYTPGESASP